MDFIQQEAFRRALREGLFQAAFLARALDEITDFKIVFVFKWLFGHKGRLPITRSIVPQGNFLQPERFSFSCPHRPAPSSAG
jgi:hypothetical protein